MNTRPAKAARRLLLALAALSCHAHANPAAEQDAAMAAHAYQKQVQRSFSRCASAFFGKGGEVFAMMEVFWLSTHRPTADAAARVRLDDADDAPKATAPLPFMQAFDTADAKTRHGLCESLFERQQKGSLKYELAEPQRADVLKRVFGTEREWHLAQRNADFTTGCMKRHWNTGRRQIDEIKAACVCQTDVMLRVASDDELDAFVDAMGPSSGKEKPSLDNTPWLKAAAPLVAACVKTP